MLVDPPYVLLDDARAGGAPARLYPRSGADRGGATRRPRCGRRSTRCARRASGLHAAGFLAYEAGDGVRAARAATAGARRRCRCCGSGCSSGYETLDDVPALLPDPAGAWIGAPEPEIARDAL